MIIFEKENIVYNNDQIEKIFNIAPSEEVLPSNNLVRESTFGESSKTSIVDAMMSTSP